MEEVMKISWLINKKAVKQYALTVAKGRAHKFTRVSSDFFNTMNAKVRNIIDQHIHSLPSVGCTIR